MRHCGNCYFAKMNKRSNTAQERECHRHAPQPGIGDLSVPAVWPAVGEDDVCGEWKPDVVTVKARQEKRRLRLQKRREKRLRA